VTYASAFYIIRLLMNLAGIFLLFVFGTPFRLRRGNRLVSLLEQPDSTTIRAERWYDMFAWLGLALIVLKAIFL
jgi:cytochrome b561